MSREIGEPPPNRRHVGVRQAILGHAAMKFQRPHRRHDDRGVRREVARTALDVQELLGAEVRSEARLGDYDVGEPQRQVGCCQRIAAVGNVAERPAVHERRPSFQGLDQVGEYGILEEERHRAFGLEVGGVDRSAVFGGSHNHAGQARPEVLQIA